MDRLACVCYFCQNCIFLIIKISNKINIYEKHYQVIASLILLPEKVFQLKFTMEALFCSPSRQSQKILRSANSAKLTGVAKNHFFLTFLKPDIQ